MTLALKHCPNCGTPFHPKGNQVFCTTECREGHAPTSPLEARSTALLALMSIAHDLGADPEDRIKAADLILENTEVRIEDFPGFEVET